MGRKHCGKRRTLLITSNFAFSNSVFKRNVLQTHKNQGLFGKGLSATSSIQSFAAISYFYLQISLPGISKDIFLAIREFLYTGECPARATLNCLGIIEVANRLCLPRLVTLVEAQVVNDLTDEDKSGEDIIEDVLTLVEPAKVHGECV